MLDLSVVDLESLMEALEDHSDFLSWFFDPVTGGVDVRGDDIDEDDDEDYEEERPENSHLIPIDSIDSRIGYEDMVAFTELVRDPRAGDLLSRALNGRGAFRRFKDTLFDFPELRQEWFAFHDRRMRRRAIEWLVDEGIVSAEDANRAIAELGEESLEHAGALDAVELAGTAAKQLREIYGFRLVRVLLYGSQARAEAGADSDIDLLVVLRDMESPWNELRRMDDVLWRLSLEHGVIFSALPVTEFEIDHAVKPVLIEARNHGTPVG